MLKVTFFILVNIKVGLPKAYKTTIELWNIVSYIKEGMQAKCIWKQDPEVNICAQERWEWKLEKAPKWETSYFVPFT